LSSLAAGSTLSDGRYRLEDVLGRGGMAIVWRATDLQLERTVAIKVISDVLAGDPRFVQRFDHEARLAAGLSHPNLVKLFDYSVEEERPFLVMEYVAGGTLREARGVQLDSLALGRELLDALAHIHAAGILHRDVKPANVLLDTDGSPRLTDFGIARSEDQTGLTLTGQVMGTLRYIAPEVAAGQPATARSDLFSLGVLLGEIAGEGPPEPLERLLPRLTAREPEERPASAADALDELDPTRALPRTEAHDTMDATQALPATEIGTASPRTVHRHRRARIRPAHLVAGAAILIVLLAVVIAAGSGGGDSNRPATPRTLPKPAPAGATVDDQLTQLEQIVRAAPRKP
jgi:serine/threonine protein kinase